MMHKENAWDLVARYTHPTQASLYRTLYGGGAKEITSDDEWNRLPFLTKDILIATPFRDRLFSKGGDHIRASSGTSGKAPLFSPRTYLRHMEYRFEYHDFKAGILAYHVPAAPYWHEDVQRSRGLIPNVITFDPKNPGASVRLAKLAGVDAISTFAFHLTMIGEHMRAEGMHEDIRFIEICGEACTPQLFAFLRETFPNATIIPFYGSSEVEDSPIGFPCHAIDGSDPYSVYHAKESQYHELIDPINGVILEPNAGVEGELVVTAYPGEYAAFPLIRYRTGDMVRVVETQCEKHASWSFTVLGRVQMDFIKVPGGMIRVDEMERVIALIPELTGEFEMHIFEETLNGAPKIRMELHVQSKGEADFDKIARTVARQFRINADISYEDGVADGRFLPLTCLAFTPKPGKRKRLHRF